MGVRGDVLRHKKWNVWNPDNLEKVRQDVEADRQRKDQLREQLAKQEAAYRYEVMRSRQERGVDEDGEAQPSRPSETRNEEARHIKKRKARSESPPPLDPKHASKPKYLQDMIRRGDRSSCENPSRGDNTSHNESSSSARKRSEHQSSSSTSARQTSASSSGKTGDSFVNDPNATGKFREVWWDKTNHREYVKFVDQMDMSHALNKGKQEDVPWYQKSENKNAQLDPRQEAKKAVRDPLFLMNEFMRKPGKEDPVEADVPVSPILTESREMHDKGWHHSNDDWDSDRAKARKTKYHYPDSPSEKGGEKKHSKRTKRDREPSSGAERREKHNKKHELKRKRRILMDLRAEREVLANLCSSLGL